MRLIKEGDKYRTFIDGDSFIKVGPRSSIMWEHDILKDLEGIAGIPQVRGLTPPMGGISGDLTLITDKMNGVQLNDVDDKVLPAVLPSLYSLLLTIYTRNITHLRVTPDHVIVDPSGNVSLVGFSKAARVETVYQTSYSSSPDLTGVINHEVVRLKSPHIPKVDGSYMGIAKIIMERGGKHAINN